ncbi:G-protein coupled receptor 4-like [Huso huso]|uniref:G-protein coupled receptor 4-like n=1 Tax=Huso huso TaxID=61971 RepID=A0ABR0Z2E2_HUSHU
MEVRNSQNGSNSTGTCIKEDDMYVNTLFLSDSLLSIFYPVYLVNLCVSDLLYILSLPVWIQNSLRPHVGNTLCSLTYFIMDNSFYIAASFLCCISADRYLAVVYPLYFATLRSVKFAVQMSIVIWVVELSLHIIYLYYEDMLYSFSDNKPPIPEKVAIVNLIRCLTGFLLPLLLMFFFYMRILKSVFASTGTEDSEKRKIMRLLFLLLMTYFVSFAPYQTIMFLRSIWEPRNCAFAEQMRHPYLLSVALTTLNSVLDPVFYCFVSESAKNEIKKLQQSLKGKLKNMPFKKSPSTSTVHTVSLNQIHPC